MRRLTAILMITLLWATPALSGAWPRGKGNVFFQSALRVSASDKTGPYAVYSTTYLEYGATDTLTFGLDLGHGVSGDTKAIVFARLPIAVIADKHHVAVELGAGTLAGQATLRPGLSYGRGFKTVRDMTGWFAIDSFAELRTASGQVDFKTDITLGLNHNDRFKSMIQFQSGMSEGDNIFLRVEPSLVIRLGKKSHIELGLTAGLVGEDQLGVKFGFWRDF
ncbi:MAG: hypothetical protein CSA70_09125 [Rhodobacterales bacterium]|nr:MAG: hypothetical protein CSA70_09125 [Rhodobacterales bacterium]